MINKRDFPFIRIVGSKADLDNFPRIMKGYLENISKDLAIPTAELAQEIAQYRLRADGQIGFKEDLKDSVKIYNLGSKKRSKLYIKNRLNSSRETTVQEAFMNEFGEQNPRWKSFKGNPKLKRWADIKGIFQKSGGVFVGGKNSRVKWKNSKNYFWTPTIWTVDKRVDKLFDDKIREVFNRFG